MTFIAIILFLPTIAIAVQTKESDGYCEIMGISEKYEGQRIGIFKEWAIKVGEKCQLGDSIHFLESSQRLLHLKLL